jgi:molybdopterin molybdotransferase
MRAPIALMSVAEALNAILFHTWPLVARYCPLESALGLSLIEQVVADIDLPPFDKSIVDGYAIRSADVARGTTKLLVVEEVLAGMTPSRTLGTGEASAIMTGAPMPKGADAIVMFERVERPEKDIVVVHGPILPGHNRMPRGREMRAGDIVVPAGAVLDSAKLGVLASVGASEALVQPRPIVAIASTGDEIVPCDQKPGPGQIRNSNTPLLAGLVQEHGAIPRPLPIIPDRLDSLIDAFSRALDGPEPADVLLVSGGVSAGQRDLVPNAFARLGIEEVFHKVKVKPGKPIWFGARSSREGVPPTLVFGLPGNPVSGLVCFLLFVRPALEILSGHRSASPHSMPTFPLAAPVQHRDDRDNYRPARFTAPSDDPGSTIEVLPSVGSSDLRAVASADGFAIFPAGERTYNAGDPVGFLDRRSWRFTARPS